VAYLPGGNNMLLALNANRWIGNFYIFTYIWMLEFACGSWIDVWFHH
jgi:hypothetical protein